MLRAQNKTSESRGAEDIGIAVRGPIAKKLKRADPAGTTPGRLVPRFRL